MDSSNSSQIWNVPNQLTMARLILAIVMFFCLSFGWYWVSFVLFFIAASTDWMDGWWARKYDQVTQLGRILDPFCDKFLMCGTFVMLAVATKEFPWYARVQGWMVVAIIAREMLVTALRSFIEQSGGDFSASWSGKLKMWFQCFAAGAALIALAVSELDEDPEQVVIPVLWQWAVGIFMWVAVASTLYSGYQYVMAAIGMIKPSDK